MAGAFEARTPYGHADIRTMLKNQNANLVTYPSEARGWTQILARYREPSPARSIIELVVTAGPFVLLWFLMWATLDLGYWVCLLLAVPAAGFLVRLFMIQHDCGHGAFFHNRLANDSVGRVIGVLTLTPYDYWRRTHAIHHSTSGNLDRRGIGDVDTLTVHCTSRYPDGVGFATAFTDTRSSCSAWARPFCSSSNIGCHLVSCVLGGSPGSAPWGPTSPSRLSSPS
jgi:hypothetical protein